MSAPFKAGDWARIAGNGPIYQVAAIDAKREDGYSVRLDEFSYGPRTGWVSPDVLVPVRVTFPKPRRKLTLSQGLAWLKNDHLLALNSDGEDWGVWNIKQDRFVCGVMSTTPLKAIIAARKALGVKS